MNVQRRSSGIGTGTIVGAVIALVVIGGAGYYIIDDTNLLDDKTTAAQCPTTTVLTFGNETTTTGVLCDFSGSSSPTSGTSTSTTNPTSLSTSTGTTSESTTSGQYETFRVNFQWSGQTVSGNTTDAQQGSGTFLIIIDLSTGVGSANGTGHVDLDESGLCTATNSTDYTFTVSGTLDPVSGNLTLDGGNPSPSEFTAVRSCTNPYNFPPDVLSWPAFYPSQVTLPATYGASVTGTIEGFIQYEVTLA